jgi:hypothetical protein
MLQRNDQLLAFPPALDALPLPLPALPAPPALTAPPAFDFLASASASLFPRQSDTQSASAAATPPTLCGPDAPGSPVSQLGLQDLVVREPSPAATPSARASRLSPAEPPLTSCLFAPSGAHATSCSLRDLHASSALVSQSRTRAAGATHTACSRTYRFLPLSPCTSAFPHPPSFTASAFFFRFCCRLLHGEAVLKSRKGQGAAKGRTQGREGAS